VGSGPSGKGGWLLLCVCVDCGPLFVKGCAVLLVLLLRGIGTFSTSPKTEKKGMIFLNSVFQRRGHPL
jgi:hypothetical protein